MNDLVKLVHEGVDVLELSVNRGKSDISNLVDALLFFHGIGADHVGRDLAVKGVLQQILDLVNDLLKSINGDRTLFTGSHHTVEELVSVKRLARLVLLDDYHRNALDDLVGCESFAAIETFSSATDPFALIRWAGINNFAFIKAAIWTLHGDTSKYRTIITEIMEKIKQFRHILL